MRYINSAKNEKALKSLSNKFFVMEDMDLETDSGNLSMKSGEEINLGQDENENLVVREVNRIFVVDDKGIAEAILNNSVCLEEMTAIKNQKMSFEEAIKEGVSSDNIIKSVIDGVEDAYTAATIERKTTLNPAYKASIIAGNKYKSGNKGIKVEAITVYEGSNRMHLSNMLVTEDNNAEQYDNEEEFTNNANNVNATVEVGPDNTLIAKINVDNVIGLFNKNECEGTLFKNKEFNNVEDLKVAIDNIDNKVNVVNDFEWEDKVSDEDLDNIDAAIGECENSNRSEEDIEVLFNKLQNSGLNKEEAEEICNCYKN